MDFWPSKTAQRPFYVPKVQPDLASSSSPPAASPLWYPSQVGRRMEPGMSHTSAHKRRSPPPNVHRRAASPLPPPSAVPSIPTGPAPASGMASSSAYGRSSQSGLGKGYPPSMSDSPAPAFLSLDDPEVASIPISQSNGAGPNGGYAYSTTLRRQASTDHFQLLGRSASPHASTSASALSPFRKRTGSAGAYSGDNPYAYSPASINEATASPGAGVGMVERAIRAGRRLIGAQTDGYEAIDLGAEEVARAEGQKRMTETPSAIYAHKSVEDTIEAFSTHPTAGLSNPQLPALLARYGPNEFQLPPSEPLAVKFAKQVYENPLILLLLGSSVVSALLGSYDDAVCVVIAVAIVLTVAFVQEQRSEKSLEALNKLVPHYCHLVRNGQPLTPLANTLLPGDLITFSVGDRIPADVRLISAIGLEIDESALTGETRPSKKRVEECVSGVGEDTHGEGGGKGLGERRCVGFMGTLVRSGHGTGVVVATGKDTEFGVIFSMMQDVEEKRTPLQIAMDDLAKRLSIFSFGVIGVIIIIGVWQKRGWLEMFTIGVSLAVAAIPEGLPIVTTVTLALGVLRMSKRKAIVKKLHSVEALGSVSVICSDKTGTLTTNEMTVTHLYAVDDLMDLTPHLNKDPFAPRHPDHPAFCPSPAMLKTATIGSICNNAFRNEAGVNVGQATEVALLNILPLLQREDERKSFTRKSECPFSSENKFMAVTGSMNGGSDMVYMKGAPEAVLARCRYYYVTDSSTPSLDPATQKLILERTKEVAKRGLRVIAMAYGFPSAPNGKAVPTDGVEDPGSDLIFVGFEAMMDPPRKGVAASIASLHGAGVQVVMITGDAEATALAIARELGLKVNPSSTATHYSMSSCMLGTQVDQLSERELIERVPNITVFARTTPRHKMAIVKAWQMRGAVVAMTGDGVNDAPALKMADIGISMGKSGTDVAKEAADVILVDDDFSSVLPAVEEGKSIFYNIQNFLSFQLSTAVAALSLITISTFLELANPLNAMQILFINILMDGPPAQALGVDPVDREIMKRPPRKKNEQILSRRLMLRIAFSAAMIVLGTLFVYVYEMGDGITRRDQTMTFTCFVFLDLVSALQNRGLTCPMFRNRMLSLTVGVSFLAQLALVYLPILQHVFQTEALSLRDLLTLLGLAGTSMVAHEGRRWWERKVGAEEVWVRGAGVV